MRVNENLKEFRNPDFSSLLVTSTIFIECVESGAVRSDHSKSGAQKF